MRINLSSLNSVQRRAVEKIDGALLIIAGAGTGKTRVITYRIANMLNKKIPARNILALTFTNKAAREMKERVISLLGNEIAKDLTISTFHSLGLRILREDGKTLGINRNFLIYNTSDQESLIKLIFKEKYNISSVDNATVKDILNIISQAKSNNIDVEDFKESANSESLVLASKIYEHYDKYLRMYGAVDFDDLILLPVKLFENYPAIKKKYQERYKYIMIDEYQDTNNLQFNFVNYIAGHYPNICVVGDDDQSIYAFRGANLNNILNFKNQYDDVEEIKLEENYRSTTNILLAANNVIKKNNQRMNKVLFSSLGDGPLITHYIVDTPKDEAEQLALKVWQMKNNKIDYNEIAVLYRSNHQSREIETEFRAKGINYKVVGGTDFYDRKEIKDVISYLSVLVNKEDEINLRRIINYPPRGIGSKTIFELNNYAKERNISFYKALKRADEIFTREKTKKSIKDFINLIERYSDVLTKTLNKENLYNLIEDIGIVTQILSENKDNKVAHNKKANIIALIDSIIDLNISLKEFIIKFILRDDIKKEENSKKVTLLSIHAAKGLEFSYVFLIGFNENILPHQRSIDTGNNFDIEEERRLCYVAITRAKKQLILSSVTNKQIRGQKFSYDFSRFLKDIPKNLINTIDFTKNESELSLEESQDSAFEQMDKLFEDGLFDW